MPRISFSFSIACASSRRRLDKTSSSRMRCLSSIFSGRLLGRYSERYKGSLLPSTLTMISLGILGICNKTLQKNLLQFEPALFHRFAADSRRFQRSLFSCYYPIGLSLDDLRDLARYFPSTNTFNPSSPERRICRISATTPV